MPEIKTTVLPLGEFAPDAQEFGNPTERLLKCRNLVPVYGNYCAAPGWVARTDALAARPRGLHAISTGYSTYLIYHGDDTKLWRTTPSVTPPWAVTDVSRAVGGAYNTAGTGGENGWQFCAFGRDEIATNYVDDVQINIASAANFVKMAQSGGANPGMDPKAKFVGVVQNNVFLANCNLAAIFDGLAAGIQPNLVAWSQSDNPRQFGSFNATPQLIGAGYQQILNDFGDITGFVGTGDYGIVAQQRAFVRIDGPPYQFRPIVTGSGTRFPNSLRSFSGDIYGWGAAGPFVLIGGEGPIVYLGSGKLIRTLIDNLTQFSLDAITTDIDIRYVSLAIDPTNGLLQYTITSTQRGAILATPQEGDLTIWYNIAEERFSFADSSVPAIDVDHLAGVLYLCSRPDIGDLWLPGRTSIGVIDEIGDLGAISSFIGEPFLASTTTVKFPSIRKPFIQLDPDHTTRVRRIRPIYAISAGSISVTATIRCKNRPFDAPTSYTFTTLDTHGWIATPTSIFADYHSFTFDFGIATEDPGNILELAAIEVEYEIGGRYAA